MENKNNDQSNFLHKKIFLNLKNIKNNNQRIEGITENKLRK